MRRNTRCRQQMLGTTSCSQGQLGRSGRVVYYDIMFAHNVPVYVATRKRRVLKVTPRVATPGAESAVCDCFVTARCYASAVLAMSLCLSVSVCQCSTKTAKLRITQTTPHDTPGTLVFWCKSPTSYHRFGQDLSYK